MATEQFVARKGPAVAVIVVAIIVLALLTLPVGRGLAGRFFRSLRVQKVQAVNVDLSPFTDPNANPALHQMVAQMISDKMQVEVNEPNQPATDTVAASQLAGFPVQLLTARKDSPKFDVGGAHKINMTVDRTRLQAIINEAGHSDLTLPQSLDGASVSVQIPRSVTVQYGTCPGRTSSTNSIAGNIAGPPQTTMQYTDCVRLREGPSPIVNVPPGLDMENLAQIGLETAGMIPSQAHDFLQTVDWKATLSMSVPRFLRSYQEVKVAGTNGTLLTMAGRRGPGYTLTWAKNGIIYNLTGFGESTQAVELADSLK